MIKKNKKKKKLANTTRKRISYDISKKQVNLMMQDKKKKSINWKYRVNLIKKKINFQNIIIDLVCSCTNIIPPYKQRTRMVSFLKFFLGHLT